MTSSVIRIRQQGFVRTTGNQLSNWAVTVPVSDPGGTPLLATAPPMYEALFVLFTQGAQESLVRVATLTDLGKIAEAELRYFDLLGPGGDIVFAPAYPNGPLGPFAADELVFTNETVPHWLESLPPYTSLNFTVKRCAAKASGVSPSVLTGNRLILPGYSFKSSDVGRWVALSGFVSASYNGLARIVWVDGDVAVISKTIVSNETGTSWLLPWIEIETRADTALEPRFFPTREANIPWALRRGGIVIAQGAAGGFTSRQTEAVLVRSRRWTGVYPSETDAVNAAASIRNGVYNLAQAADLADSSFLSLTTSTYGV